MVQVLKLEKNIWPFACELFDLKLGPRLVEARMVVVLRVNLKHCLIWTFIRVHVYNRMRFFYFIKPSEIQDSKARELVNNGGFVGLMKLVSSLSLSLLGPPQRHITCNFQLPTNTLWTSWYDIDVKKNIKIELRVHEFNLPVMTKEDSQLRELAFKPYNLTLHHFNHEPESYTILQQ